MQSAKEKLQTLYQIYEKPMYHIAYAILHHPQQAEDAVSEAFCRVIRHLDKIGEPEHPKTKQYMIRIIRSTAISQYRKNARESSRYAPWDDGILQIPTEDTPVTSSEQQERQMAERLAISEMLGVLNATDTKIVLLRCQQDMPFREIARQCGMKEAAVRKRFERARKAMMKQKGVTSYEQLFSLQ